VAEIEHCSQGMPHNTILQLIENSALRAPSTELSSDGYAYIHTLGYCLNGLNKLTRVFLQANQKCQCQCHINLNIHQQVSKCLMQNTMPPHQQISSTLYCCSKRLTHQTHPGMVWMEFSPSPCVSRKRISWHLL